MDIEKLCEKLFETHRNNPENSLVSEVSQWEEDYILSSLKRVCISDSPLALSAIVQIREEGNASQLIAFLNEEQDEHPHDHIELSREISVLACFIGSLENTREALALLTASDSCPADLYIYSMWGNV